MPLGTVTDSSRWRPAAYLSEPALEFLVSFLFSLLPLSGANSVCFPGFVNCRERRALAVLPWTEVRRSESVSHQTGGLHLARPWASPLFYASFTIDYLHCSYLSLLDYRCQRPAHWGQQWLPPQEETAARAITHQQHRTKVPNNNSLRGEKQWGFMFWTVL